jgi:putative SOS response-associated peptidase YedK
MGRQWAWLRWGLVPSWAKDPGIGHSLINARAETVRDKPAFRSALRRRRCLIPASGFFEWSAQGKKKQPHFFTSQDGKPLSGFGVLDSGQSDVADADFRGHKLDRDMLELLRSG